MHKLLFILLMLFFISCSVPSEKQAVTTADLLNELTDLERLTYIPLHYKTIQFSSYDRRSTRPTDSCWFANEDGFGNEPIPGFEKTIKGPEANGIGEYLICDVKHPGAIVRLWTAGISGDIRLYLDSKILYEGKAEEFFRNTPEVLTGEKYPGFQTIFSQFDASYFPIPFEKSCRIEWIGDIREKHFYHVEMRIYDKDIKIESFKKEDVSKWMDSKAETKAILTPGTTDVVIDPNSSKEIFHISGQQAVNYFSIKISSANIESALRKNVLSVYFDNSSVPQIEAPVGDFFGSAPGIYPLESIPFSVDTSGNMICRFIMPFRQNASFRIHNFSDQKTSVTFAVTTKEYSWIPGESMHFRARWKIENDIIAPNINANGTVSDILYLMASGKGRLVGTAAYLYNPSNSVTSWGNWWGEGDEKIYVDQDSFPSFFGTGSEDYFNYSWSSANIFSYPYCGQPRNDGPGNRGYVSNFRWHIIDDIPFYDKISFSMEIGNHGEVPGFSYGRIAYFYALPDVIDDYRRISMSDIREPVYNYWSPIAYCGSVGFDFAQAEKLAVTKGPSVKIINGKLWAENQILEWMPANPSEKLVFNFSSGKAAEGTTIGFTIAHGPDEGIIKIFLNDALVKVSGSDSLDLFQKDRQVLANHFTEAVNLKKGKNELRVEMLSTGKNKKADFDFFWFKKNLN